MIWLLAGVVLCVTSPVVLGDTVSFDWCYHDATCDDSTWPEKAAKYCNGSRQSPIDIVPGNAKVNSRLGDFTFTNFNSKSVFTKIENTGQTVKMSFGSGVKVSGGDLNVSYDSLQFHLHWGNGSTVPGSEHTVDGKRYPMELHIVSIKGKYNGNTSLALADSDGAAALGFFIEAVDNTTNEPAAWRTLTSYLSKIALKGQYANVSNGISLDELVAGVNRSRYYRYKGSLTTPLCHEIVVWTVFKEPVKISKNLIDMFANTVHIGNDASSRFMRNVFRRIQPAQEVTHNAVSRMSFSSALIVLMAAFWMR